MDPLIPGPTIDLQVDASRTWGGLVLVDLDGDAEAAAAGEPGATHARNCMWVCSKCMMPSTSGARDGGRGSDGKRGNKGGTAAGGTPGLSRTHSASRRRDDYDDDEFDLQRGGKDSAYEVAGNFQSGSCGGCFGGGRSGRVHPE